MLSTDNQETRQRGAILHFHLENVRDYTTKPAQMAVVIHGFSDQAILANQGKVDNLPYIYLVSDGAEDDGLTVLFYQGCDGYDWRTGEPVDMESHWSLDVSYLPRPRKAAILRTRLTAEEARIRFVLETSGAKIKEIVKDRYSDRVDILLRSY